MKRIRTSLFIILTSVLVLEFALQLLSVGAYFFYAREPMLPLSNRPRILFVGDSYTFGDGASSSEHSYPKAMQRWLVKQDLHVEVINDGWPGQNSLDVIRRLGQRVEELRPHIVCILVGTNDAWTRPLRWQGDRLSQGNGYQLRWRTGRLIQLLFRRHESDWTQRGDKQALHHPAPENPTATSHSAESSESTPAMWSFGLRLLQKAGIELAPQASRLDPPEVPAAAKVRTQAQKAIWKQKEFAQAIQLLEPAIAQYPEATHLVSLLVEAQTMSGQSEKTSGLLKMLEHAYQERSTSERGLALLHALWVMNKSDRAFEFAKSLVERFPNLSPAWSKLADLAFRRDLELCAIASERFLELSGPYQKWMNSSLGNLSRSLAGQHPERSAEIATAALLLSGRINTEAALAYRMIWWNNHETHPRLTELRSDPALDKIGRRLLQEVTDEASGKTQSDWPDVLEYNLVAMHEMVAHFGGRMVVINYPFAGKHEVPQRAAAYRTGSIYANIRQRFDVELMEKKRDRNELFVADGHCNDAGYAIMAEEVGKVVLGLLRKN